MDGDFGMVILVPFRRERECLGYTEDDSGLLPFPCHGGETCYSHIIFFRRLYWNGLCIVLIMYVMIYNHYQLYHNEGPNELTSLISGNLLVYSTQISNFPSALPRLRTLSISSPLTSSKGMMKKGRNTECVRIQKG